ncbi:MAG: helix-turn-helix transcriptional regulator [Verrucomicrobia bacterium]|nr:helix-turn-helix transcriptional regulator [Verrucomicrobiota bacterium]
MGTQAPVLASANAPWRGLWLEHHRYSPFEKTDVCCLNHVIFLHLQTPATMELKNGERFHETRILPGQLGIRPALSPFSIRCRDSGECLVVSLEQNFLACATCELGNGDSAELVFAHGIEDSFLQAVCLALKADVESGWQGGRLYGESLATALAVHLVKNHSARGAQVREFRGGLAKYQLRRALEYINEHLAEEISLKSLAAIADLSPFHFARMFKQSTGLAPHQYLLKCRVGRAKELLLDTNASIADVALRLGFCDQSHLSTHFKRSYGVTPRTFVRQIIGRKNVG